MSRPPPDLTRKLFQLLLGKIEAAAPASSARLIFDG
jgi:hypothetical protein